MLLGLSVERTVQKEHHQYGTLFGKAHQAPPAEAIFDIFEALGSIAFSFSFVSTPQSDQIPTIQAVHDIESNLYCHQGEIFPAFGFCNCLLETVNDQCLCLSVTISCHGTLSAG